MGKQQPPKPPKENPLMGKNIPKPPAIPADQPIQEEEQQPTVINSTLPQSSNAVPNSNIQQNVNTAKQHDTVKQQSSKREKITFYLEAEQASKLYDFMEAFRKRTGVKINQQDMLRRIIDVMTIDTVLP